MVKYFEEHFQWKSIHDNVAYLDDGAVSVIIKYHGWDFSLMDAERLLQSKRQLQNLLHELKPNYVIEFHLLRVFNNTVSDRYRNFPVKRALQVTKWFRDAIADQVAQSEMKNNCYVILTRIDSKSPFSPAKRLARQHALAQEILETANSLMRHLPQGEIAPMSTMFHIINFCYAKKRPDTTTSIGDLRHHWICMGKPKESENTLQLPDGRYCTTLLLQLYPNCTQGWITSIAGIFGECHIVQIITTADEYEIRKSKKAEDLAHALSSREGTEEATVIAGDQQGLRMHLAEHQLKLFKNLVSITLYDNSQSNLKKRVAEMTDYLHEQGALVRSYSELQFAGWFYQLPAQGHRNRRWRVDETWQVVAMIPCQQFYIGRSDAPFILRLGAGYQGVTLGYRSGEVAHHCTIAITGAGKSLDRCARILECFGLGIDMYLLEIGKSAWWAIEAVGGEYHAIDPDTMAINPLPALSCLNENQTLPQDIVSVTVDTLAFLLKPTTNVTLSLDTFERATIQMALVKCYQPIPIKQPTLIDLRNSLLNCENPDIPQIAECAKRMSDYLSAFLISMEGIKFMSNSELTINPGACGIDLSLVRSKAPSLLKLYLVFVALKFGQMASSNKRPSEIILDETHEFVRLAPDVMGPLIEGLARMGRKEASFIDLITQEVGEIDAIGRAVMNQMIRKTMLYRTSDHDALAERIGMIPEVVSLWKSWPTPFFNDWRPGLEFDGNNWVELLLSFPPEVMALTRTDPESAILKESISKQTTDPIERVRRFINENK
ncbi:MAG: hypothetical protein QM538_02560 [Methylacidiphilales bacterium]|nr:hypothetical protein [Candidatus Methylacidiphilales bacterium]